MMEVQSTGIYIYDTDNIKRPLTDDKIKEFETLVRPVIRFLNDNFNPHVKAIIDTAGGEIVSGEVSVKIKDYTIEGEK